jgi:hypothetical protein
MLYVQIWQWRLGKSQDGRRYTIPICRDFHFANITAIPSEWRLRFFELVELT